VASVLSAYAGLKAGETAKEHPMQEPGLDRHEWETEWEALEPLLRDSPTEALPELDRLVERMLRERGIPVDDEVADDGIDPELLAAFRSARELTRLFESDADVSPGDAATAVEDYRSVYQWLLESRAAP
jgi:hypothetical protein